MWVRRLLAFLKVSLLTLLNEREYTQILHNACRLRAGLPSNERGRPPRPRACPRFHVCLTPTPDMDGEEDARDKLKYIIRAGS